MSVLYEQEKEKYGNTTWNVYSKNVLGSGIVLGIFVEYAFLVCHCGLRLFLYKCMLKIRIMGSFELHILRRRILLGAEFHR